jgi:glycosyltransferase involved in cell wall biosynthesis
MLCNLVEAMQDGPWRTVVVAVKTGTTGCKAERMREIADAFYDLDSPSLLRPALFKKLKAIIAQERPDVVQTWMHHADFVGGLAARLSGVKHVVWGIHSRTIFRWPGDSDLKFSLFQMAIRAASMAIPRKIVSCSETAINDHASMGFPRRKMAFIANGICTKRFRPSVETGVKTRIALDIPLDAPVVGFVGRFHPVKNLQLYFRAAAVLLRKMPETHFIMSGGSADTLDEQASAAFESLPDRSRVHFLPFNAATEEVYPACSVFTLCSESEALPMTILEAMACGVPCVTTDVGDCATVIADTGLVVPPSDPAALAAGWEKMLTADSATRNALSQSARARVVANFSIAHAAEQYQHTYQSLIES